MSKLRVCLYGGTDLNGMPSAFVASLAEEILVSLPAVIVTGGFLRRMDRPAAVSTDAAALQGARSAARRMSVELHDMYEAWVPEGRLDGRPDVGGVVRMTEDLGIKVRDVAGRTALGRRLAMVANVDVVVTFAGSGHTEVILERAIEVGVPALPIPHTGGTSQRVWESYRDRIEAAFAPGEVAACFDALSSEGMESPRSAPGVVHVIRSARIGRCLVLQPYRKPDDELYRTIIAPTVEEEMVPIRLKDASGSRVIHSSFVDSVETSTTILADITQINENVMYEIGYAHGRGLEPLLFTLDPARIAALPVYFQALNVHAVELDRLPDLIRAHLRAVKRRRNDAVFDAR